MSADSYSSYHPALFSSPSDWQSPPDFRIDDFLLFQPYDTNSSPTSSAGSLQSPLSFTSTFDGTERSSAPTSPGSCTALDPLYDSFPPCHVPPVQYIAPSLLHDNYGLTYSPYSNSPKTFPTIVEPSPRVAAGPFSFGNASPIFPAFTPPAQLVEPPVSPLPIQGLTQLTIHDDHHHENAVVDSDEDAEGEDDDEYIPSPRPTKARRRLPPSRASTRSASVSSASTSPSASPSVSSRRVSPVKKARVSPPSRNLQVRSRRHSPLTTAQEAMRRSFKCPVCHFTQNNRRLPDLDRHIRTHYRDELNQPKCKGVPLARAAEFGLDPADAKPGATHIGGCWMTFARLDALKRHLHNPNTNCVGIA